MNDAEKVQHLKDEWFCFVLRFLKSLVSIIPNRVHRKVANNPYFLIGILPPLILFTYNFVLEGHYIPATPDIFLPFLSGHSNLEAYISPWKPWGCGSNNAASISYVYDYVLQLITNNYAISQHFILLIPILISYLSAYYVIKVLIGDDLVSSLCANIYVFNALFLQESTGATGLIYFYSFVPFALGHWISISRSSTFSLRNILGASIADFALPR